MHIEFPITKYIYEKPSVFKLMQSLNNFKKNPSVIFLIYVCTMIIVKHPLVNCIMLIDNLQSFEIENKD